MKEHEMTETQEIIHLLRDISEKLNRLILIQPPYPINPDPNIPNPYIPPDVPTPWPTVEEVRCPKCGISGNAAMGYVCSDSACPWYPRIT